MLDAAARLLVITRRRGREVGRKEFVLSPQPTEVFAHSVSELGVDVLLCAALSDPLLRALERERVRVRPHLCGEVESVLQAYCCDRINRDEYRMPGCLGIHLHGACCEKRWSLRRIKAYAKGKSQEKKVSK